MACLGALAGYWHLQTNPDAPLFLAGVVLAEMFLVRQEGALLEKARLSDERLESPSTTSNARAESRNERMGNTAMFILALFFLGFPRRGADKAMFWGPWYTIAVWLVPDAQQFYLVTGAVLLVYSVSRSPSLQRLFTTELARYLGKISFALYLVHMAILLWFGYSSIELWWWVCGTETLWRWGLALAIAFLGQVVVVVWVADVFWRAVDAPSVRFARWIEERCKAES
jgi:peptidoglycan/LPS O-acetylase OafA/YrhL